MKARHSTFCILHSAFCIATVALAAAAASATVAPGFLGVCEHVNDAGDGFFFRNRTFNVCNRAGITWLRVDFPWADVEPTQGNWQWDKFDTILDDAEAHGIQILPILDYGSAYGGHEKLVSDDLDGWTTYVSNVVTRYAGRLPAVEVWNEPNIGPDPDDPDKWYFWSGTTAQYVTMLRATYNAVKAIDPSIRVVLGGLSGECSGYVTDLYANGAKGCFDVMAMHPYSGSHAPDDVWKGNFLTGYTYYLRGYIEATREVMESNGDGNVPIWLTEHGWSTHSSGSTSEAKQATYIAKAMEIAADCGIEKYFIYNLIAYEGDLSNPEHCFGIIHNDYTPKPAFTAVQSKIRELTGAAADPYANYVWLTFGDYTDGQTVSWASAGYWSDGAAPSSGKDYLVDIGLFPDAKLLSSIVNHTALTFGGRSLTLGRIGGRAGYFSHEGWGSTVTVSRLVLNNGLTVVGGQTGINGEWLAGNATVASPAANPFTFESIIGQYAWARDYTLDATLSGASGTALRGLCRATEPGGASLNLAVNGDCSAYAGGFIADGPYVTLRLGAAALPAPSGADAITLRGGATFAPSGDGLTLSARTLVAEGGTGVIHVPARETFTLACPVTGTFRKTGAGTLVLDGTTGSGRFIADEGAVSVDADTAQFIAGIANGVVAYRSAEGVRTVLGVDSFEAPVRGTASAALLGWSGEGLVAAGTPTIGDPPGLPLPDATHTNALSLNGDSATRAYAAAFARDSQSFDFLVQVERQPAGADLPDFGAESVQLRLVFDSEGHPWALHGDASGAPAWSRLGFSLIDNDPSSGGAAAGGAGGAASPSFANGDWVRVSIDFDYSTNPDGLAFAQVRLDGSCLLTPNGWRTPATKAAGGSWLRLPAATASAHKVTSVEFDGALAVDDLVHAYHAPALAPAFPNGSITSADGIPFDWFDAQGIPRDPHGDPDGDHFDNARERISRKDPLDPLSQPPNFTILVVR